MPFVEITAVGRGPVDRAGWAGPVRPGGLGLVDRAWAPQARASFASRRAVGQRTSRTQPSFSKTQMTRAEMST